MSFVHLNTRDGGPHTFARGDVCTVLRVAGMSIDHLASSTTCGWYSSHS